MVHLNVPQVPERECLIDDDQLSDLLNDMDEDMREIILLQFQVDLGRYLNDARLAMDQQDTDQFQRAVHGLKGVSGTLGAPPLCEVADQVQRQAASLSISDRQAAFKSLGGLALQTSWFVTRHYRCSNLEK